MMMFKPTTNKRVLIQRGGIVLILAILTLTSLLVTLQKQEPVTRRDRLACPVGTNSPSKESEATRATGSEPFRDSCPASVSVEMSGRGFTSLPESRPAATEEKPNEKSALAELEELNTVLRTVDRELRETQERFHLNN